MQPPKCSTVLPESREPDLELGLAWKLQAGLVVAILCMFTWKSAPLCSMGLQLGTVYRLTCQTNVDLASKV